MPFSEIARFSVVVEVEVGERGRRRRVGQVVGGHVDRLHRGDRALVGRRDALLQRAHVGRERRLVTHRRRDTAEQRRHLGARLGEAEDVVDEEQHVLALVAEVLGDGEARERDAGTGARRLVHLAEHQRALRTGGRAVVLVRVLVHAEFDHLVIEVVALAGALADAGEHRVAAVGLRDVVDQLLDQHGLAHAGAAEEADLAAARVGRDQVHDLDAGDEDLGFRGLLGEVRRFLVDGAALGGDHRAGFVHRLADHVHDAAQRLVAHRHRDRRAGIGHRGAADQTFGRVHGDGAHGVLAEVLGDFEHQPAAVVVDLERVEDGREGTFEGHVHHGANHLADPALLPALVAAAFAISYLVLLRAPRRPK